MFGSEPPSPLNCCILHLTRWMVARTRQHQRRPMEKAQHIFLCGCEWLGHVQSQMHTGYAVNSDRPLINVNPWLINPRLLICVRYHFRSQVLLFRGTTAINQPGFINQGLTVFRFVRVSSYNTGWTCKANPARLRVCHAAVWQRSKRPGLFGLRIW